MSVRKVQKDLCVGDQIYSASNGEPITVISKDEQGFETEEDYFLYDEHRKLFFLTERGYRAHKEEKRESKQ